MTAWRRADTERVLAGIGQPPETDLTVLRTRIDDMGKPLAELEGLAAVMRQMAESCADVTPAAFHYLAWALIAHTEALNQRWEAAHRAAFRNSSTTA